MLHRIFCGGTFCFDCRDERYKMTAANDYRAELLGSVDALLRPNDDGGVKIGDNTFYVGPFYFEAESMNSEDIISCEKEMIESCTDAVFLLDKAACPGSIAEIMYANSLKKIIHLFYVRYDLGVETESNLHTPCWYPIQFCQMTNDNVHLHPCDDYGQAKQKAIEFIVSIN